MAAITDVWYNSIKTEGLTDHQQSLWLHALFQKSQPHSEVKQNQVTLECRRTYSWEHTWIRPQWKCQELSLLRTTAVNKTFAVSSFSLSDEYQWKIPACLVVTATAGSNECGLILDYDLVRSRNKKQRWNTIPCPYLNLEHCGLWLLSLHPEYCPVFLELLFDLLAT